jgi:hypothetical protein
MEKRKEKSWMIHFVSLKDFLTDFECKFYTRDNVELTVKWHIQEYSIIPTFKRDMKIYIKVATLDKVLVRQTDEPKDLQEWLELCTNYIKRNYKTKLDEEDIPEIENDYY